MTGSASFYAFLASRLKGLEDIRSHIFDQGNKSGYPVWVSEFSAPLELEGKSLDEIQIICLKQVRISPKFICVLDGSFGTTWNDEQVSILELELATAAFSKRDIWIFLLEPFNNPDRRILSLIEAIRFACPDARIREGVTKSRLFAEIQGILEPFERQQKTMEFGLFVQDIAQKRTPFLNFNLNLSDVQFLDGKFSPLLEVQPDETTIRTLLEKAAEEKIIPVKLAKLWIAFRHLSTAPFTDRKYEKFLPLWIETLSQWSSASAWYSLHGHFYLGRLAALNTLFTIRSNIPKRIQVEIGPPSIFADNGAVASEYYSIAKLVPSLYVKQHLLRKALRNCNAALESSTVSDLSGLFDIRGHVKLAMLNPSSGISDLKRALEIRCEKDQGPGRIGESEVHLGHAYATCGLFRKAERLLEDGVDKLLTTDRYPFTVQGLRHLGTFYSQVGRRTDAVRILQKAWVLASEHEIQDQAQQVEDELRDLGEFERI
jgi:tetratricopeptide (TPR) repeat protein